MYGSIVFAHYWVELGRFTLHILKKPQLHFLRPECVIVFTDYCIIFEGDFSILPRVEIDCGVWIIWTQKSLLGFIAVLQEL